MLQYQLVSTLAFQVLGSLSYVDYQRPIAMVTLWIGGFHVDRLEDDARLLFVEL